MKTYRKKPVEIQAVQWDGTADEGYRITRWIDSSGGISSLCWNGEFEVRYLAIFTLEGEMKAVKGDFIIRGVQGEFYPCKPDIFEATYEEV